MASPGLCPSPFATVFPMPADPVTAARAIQTASRDVFDGRGGASTPCPGRSRPPATTSTCPVLAQHDALKAKGVATIACLAVNDVHVVTAWAKASGVGDRILMIADGNGDFARALASTPIWRSSTWARAPAVRRSSPRTAS